MSPNVPKAVQHAANGPKPKPIGRRPAGFDPELGGQDEGEEPPAAAQRTVGEPQQVGATRVLAFVDTAATEERDRQGWPQPIVVAQRAPGCARAVGTGELGPQAGPCGLWVHKGGYNARDVPILPLARSKDWKTSRDSKEIQSGFAPKALCPSSDR